ncbi:MAG: hypothetical protein HIU90_04655 [Proteobacteria bacterium]|nr:hypothetical protein [Pseudomonadota bacterium]
MDLSESPDTGLIRKKFADCLSWEILEPESAPFRLSIDAGQAVPHRSWIVARDTILMAVRESARPATRDRLSNLILLAGSAGTGKTLLLAELTLLLPDLGCGVVLLSRGDLSFEFAESTVAGKGSEGQWALLIDEADHTNEETLTRLRQLGANTVIIARKPRDTAETPPDALVAHLAPMEADEIGVFLATRLHHAGLGSDLVSAQAIELLYDFSGGVARMVTILAGLALFVARMDQSMRIERRHMEEAARLRSGIFAIQPVVTPPSSGTSPTSETVSPSDTCPTSETSSPAETSNAPGGLMPASPPELLRDASVIPPEVQSSWQLDRQPRHRDRQRFWRFAKVGLAAASLGLIVTGAWLLAPGARWKIDRSEPRPTNAPVIALAMHPSAVAPVPPSASAPVPPAVQVPGVGRNRPAVADSSPGPSPTIHGSEQARHAASPPAVALPAPAPASAPAPALPATTGTLADSSAKNVPPAVRHRLPDLPLPLPPKIEPFDSAKPSPPTPAGQTGRLSASPPGSGLLPVEAPPRITVRYTRNNASAADRAEQVATAIRSADDGSVQTKAVATGNRLPSGVWYFYEEDRQAATVVAKIAGLRARLFVAGMANASSIGVPQPGVIELIPAPAHASVVGSHISSPKPRS